MEKKLELFRQERGGKAIWLTGAFSTDADTGDHTLSKLTLHAKFKSDGKNVSTDFDVEETKELAVLLPGKLVKEDRNGGLRFVTDDEVKAMARHELEALEKRRRSLRQRLSRPIRLAKSDILLGLHGLAEATIKLSPLLADYPTPGFQEDTKILELRANAKIGGKFDFKHSFEGVSANAGLTVEGSVWFGLSITHGDLSDLAEAIKGSMRLDVPAIPGFDFDLPKVSMPNLSFDTLSFDPGALANKWPKLVPFDLPMMDLSLFNSAPPIKGAWVTKPKLTVTNTAGILTVSATPGELSVTYGDTSDPYVTLDLSFTALELSENGTKGTFTYNVKSQDIPLPAPKPISAMGLKLDIGKSALTLALNNANPAKPVVIVTHAITHAEGKGIVLSDAANPATALTVDLKISYSFPLSEGDVETKVESFAIREPYPVELLGDVLRTSGKLLRLLGQIKLPDPNLPNAPEFEGLREVLRRVVDLVGASVAWLGQQASAIGNGLAGAAEAVGEVIMGVLEKITEVKPNTPSAGIFASLAFDIRLEPKTYRPVQIIVMPAGKAPKREFTTEILGIKLDLDAGFRPALVFDRTAEDWFGLCLFPEGSSNGLKLGTDLWMDREDGPDRSLGTLEQGAQSPGPAPRLIELEATPINPTDGEPKAIVLAALQAGKLRLFKTFSDGKREALKLPIDDQNFTEAFTVGVPGPLVDAGIVFGEETAANPTKPGDVLRVTHNIQVANLKKRALALLPKSSGESGEFGKLVQRVEITDVEPAFDGRALTLSMDVKVTLDQAFDPSTTLTIAVSMEDFSTKISGGTNIIINSTEVKTYEPLGLDLKIAPKDTAAFNATGSWPAFRLNLARGAERFEMTEDTLATLTYKRVATSGRGLVFQLNEFGASRGGFDLDAKVLPEPVKLGGINMPFRFTSGQISIKGSKFNSAGLAGSGQLPPALVGEANASIAMQLGRDAVGNVAVLGATAQLDKSGDPIRCHSTMFDLTITNLGFDFVNDGSYHFYFLLTGSAAFKPEGSAFSDGLLKNIRNVEIKLDKAPLGGDSATLLRSLSFLIKVEPPSRTNVFDIFTFDLRGIAFYPASDKFGGDPAMGISGKVDFSDFGDLPTPRFDFHEMQIAGPKGDKSFLPRVRFDGLTVGLKMGAIDVEGTAFSVDDRLPSLIQPAPKDRDLKVNGFLASAKISMPGWAPMSGSVGYLELDRREGPSDKRHAFYMYGQINKQSMQISTPLGTIFLREYGFGIGRRYTLAGIAQAETARSPGELIRILDEVSKYQGSLDKFEAWTPTYDNSDVTLALRGMFSVSAAKPNSPTYNEKAEKELPNPLLFDIVAAFRTDFTFLINLRAWLTTNYNDWVDEKAPQAFKTNPTLRGYMYFSVPRKEFLARMVSDKGGHVGNRPALPEPLVKAIQGVQFSSTLYIRPGLFHMEFGWPYELGFDLGKPSDAFSLRLRGGLINRIEDFSLLYGMAFRADGQVKFGGSINLGFVGASAQAQAVFALQAKILAYLSLKRPGDSIFYGMLRFDMTLGIQVEAWLRVPLGFKTITLRIGFSIHIAISIGLEAVISPQGLGGQAHVTVGISAFGKTLSIGLRMSFNNGLLNKARAQVARFEALGLAADIPPASEDGQRAERMPRPNTPRGETIAVGDDRIDRDLGNLPLPPVEPAEPDQKVPQYSGEDFTATDFWALLFPIEASDNKYVLQLIPRDMSDTEDTTRLAGGHRSSFFASPQIRKLNEIGTYRAKHTLMSDSLDILGTLETPKMSVIDNIPSVTPSGSSGERLVIEVQVDEEIEPAENGEPLYLGELLQTMFLNKAAGAGVELSEPKAPLHDIGRIALPEDRKAAADLLGEIGRSRAHLAGQAKLEAEIDEQRSALISEIVEGAEWLAQNWVDGALPRKGPIDPRHLGLTFIVDQTGLGKLFELDRAHEGPPLGAFSVEKSDALGQKGSVHLFNPPARMFRNAQPRLEPKLADTDAAGRLNEPEEGIKLNWDLEPTWGASKGFYDDPEQHLKHYRITREIIGFPGDRFSANYTVKSASPMEFKEIGDTRTVRQVRPPYQFIDDLREADPGLDGRARAVPSALRYYLLGVQQHPETGDSAERVAAFGALSALKDLRVEYKIVPVDIAGTAETAGDTDFGAVFVYEPPTPVAPRPVAPQEATLQVVYPALPSLVASDARLASSDRVKGEPGTPDLRLMLREAAPVNRRAPSQDSVALEPLTSATFDLRLWTDRAIPAGGYGSDAVSQATTRLGQEQIDALGRRASSQDVTLKLHDATGSLPPTAIEVVIERTASGAVERYFGMLADAQGNDLTTQELAALMGAESYKATDTAIEPRPGQVTKAYLRRRARPVGDTPSTWRSVSINLVILGKEHAQGKPAPLPVDTVLENFEQPVALAYRALHRKDLETDSGRLHIYRPAAGSTLQGFADDDPEANLILAPDPARRTATRLTWNARPRSLALAGMPIDATGPAAGDLYRLVSGFRVFSLNPDTFTGDANTPSDVAKAAKPIGELRLLPADQRGLSPQAFGDMARLEMGFPSDDWRDATARSARMSVTPPTTGLDPDRPSALPWFSLAESIAIFPQPRLRRIILADLDDGMVPELFAAGAPTEVHADLILPDTISSEQLSAWTLSSGTQGVTASDLSVTLKSGEKPFKVAQLREALRGLLLLPKNEQNDAALAAEQDLLADQDTRVALSNATLKLTALRIREGSTKPEPVVKNVTMPVDLVPRLHPILADTLELATLNTLDSTSSGPVFRQYTAVADAPPAPNAKTLSEHLAEIPDKRDPHGFAGLRTLGLAAGFQLFDTDTGDVLRGKELLRRINGAFAKVLKVYRILSTLNVADEGLPFADILTVPWGNGRLHWFDGGQEGVQEDDALHLRDNDTLAAVQIALRPAPDRLRPIDPDNSIIPRVTYHGLQLTDRQLEDAFDKAAVGDRENTRLDRFLITWREPGSRSFVLDLRAKAHGLESLPEVRMADGTENPLNPAVSIGYTGSQSTPNNYFLAHLRHAPLASDSEGDFPDPTQFFVSAIFLRPKTGEEGASEEFKEVGIPIELVPSNFGLSEFRLSGPSPLEDGMGLFKPYTDFDWGRILWPVVGKDADQKPIHAPASELSRLMHYAAGAFDYPYPEKDNPTVGKDGESARTVLGGAFARFWLRYLRHTTVPAALFPKRDDIHFSLGTPADPGTWQQAPDNQGRVSLVIPDDNRRGARSAFAVRPMGRYDDWARAARRRLVRDKTGWVVYDVDSADAVPAGLEDALVPNAPLAQWVTDTLPRTEPLEKPVILSARRVAHGDGTQGRGRFEIVVAHPADMVLASANRSNEALLAFEAISPELYRSFAHRAWMGLLLNRTNTPASSYDSLAPFGTAQLPDKNEGNGGSKSSYPDMLDRRVARTRLEDIQRYAPDAWLGATAFSFGQLPYFYRTHILVHFSAGIMVSERSQVTMEEGFAKLHLPAGEDGYEYRKTYAPPQWEVTDTGTLRFDLPLVRFIDAMAHEDANLWFGTEGWASAEIKPVAHLPDPGVAYRLGFETLATPTETGPRRTTLAQTFDVEIMPRPPVEPEPSDEMPDFDGHGTPYIAQNSSGQLSVAANGIEARLKGNGTFDWRIAIEAKIATPAIPANVPMALNDAENLQALASELKPGKAFQLTWQTTLAFGVNGPPANEENLRAMMLVQLTSAGWGGLALRLTEAFKLVEDGKLELGAFALPTTLPATFWADVPQGVLDYFQLENLARRDPALRLHIPPTPDDIALVQGAHTNPDALMEVVQDWLFGTARRPAITATRGDMPPLTDIVRPKSTGEE